MRKLRELFKKRLNPKFIAKPAVNPGFMVIYIFLLMVLVILWLYSVLKMFNVVLLDRLGAYINFFSFYFISAFAGLLKYRASKKRIHLISQFPVILASAKIFSLVLFGEHILSVTSELHTILFLLSGGYLMVLSFIHLLEKVNPQKKQIKFFAIFITLLWISMTVLLFIILGNNSELFYLILLMPGILFLISLTSFIYILKKKRKKKYLFFFQSAFFSLFLWVLYNPVVFGWEFWRLTGHISLSPIIWLFLVTCLVVTLISVLWFLMSHFFFRFWKRKFLCNYTGTQAGKPISIYPDAATYIDVHGKAAWLERFTRSSDGGVVGITGVRGVGKSALLNKMVDLFKNEFFTLHLTSPVHSSNRMEFFMMVCREVCARVIKDIEKRVFLFSDTGSRKAKDGVFRKIRAIALVVVIIIITAGFLTSPSYRIKQEDSLTNQNFDLLKFSVLFENTPPDSHINFSLKAEFFCIENLYKRLNKYLEQENIFDKLVVIPQAGGLYWDILPVIDDRINLINILDVFKNTVIQIKKDEFEHYFKPGKPQYVIVKPNIDSLQLNVANQLFINDKLNDEFFNVLHHFIFIRPFIYRVLGFGFYEHYGDFCERILSQQEKAAEAIFKRRNTAQLIHLTHSVTSLLGIENDFNGTPKLMSWIILRAFVTMAGSNSKKLLLDRENRARQLRDYLVAYLENLYSDGPAPGQVQVVEKKGFLYSTEFWILCIIAFLIIIGGFLVHWLNFFMTSLFNFKTFGMWMRSKEFLNLLSYSESSERKGTFTLSSILSFSMNKRQSQRELTLSGLTNLFVDYIKEVSPLYNQKMIICIDELDKLDNPEEVENILREIKGALFVRNTYYFISISRDAALRFQGRLSTGRDIFESTFDEVVSLKRLDSRQAWEIITKRLVEDSEIQANTFDWLNKRNKTAKKESNAAALAMYAGGIPREIIRFLRDVLLLYDRFDKVEPVDIGILILKQRLDELLRDVALTAVSGEKSSRLYDLLKKIKAILENPTRITPDSIIKIASFIEKCLSTIDPGNLYMKVSPSSGEKEKALYETIRVDIKKYVELLIIVEVLFYFKNHKSSKPVDEAFQAKIFSCTTALDENPALARYILDDNKQATCGN